MTTIQVAAPTALLVAGRSEQAGVAGILRELGFHPVQVDGVDGIESLRDSVALCLIDLRQNGDALRIARAVRSQHPQAVVIGIADARIHEALGRLVRPDQTVLDLVNVPKHVRSNGDYRGLCW